MEQAPRILPHLTYRDLASPSLVQAMISDHDHDYYWSEDFSPQFYVAQAQAGFIATTEQHKGTELLLPELQHHYALLDFHNLHTSRNVRRILRHHTPILSVAFTLDHVYEQIRRYHKHSWVTPRYLHTLKQVNALHTPMRVVSVLLRYEGEVVAGEMGYILGRTYTSLSGFSSRDPKWRHYGTVQLVLLGRWLKQHGFAFWNLGQTCMPYKFSLGAKGYDRRAFLQRWSEAISEPLPSWIPA